MITWILQRLRGDKVIWITIFLLALVGILAIYSASSSLSFRTAGDNTEYFMFTHLIQLCMGLVIMYVIHLVNYRLFAKISSFLLLATIPLLVYTIIQGSEINEAARWITIFGQSFQPSELAKLALIIYLAKLLTQRQAVIKDFNEGFLPALFWVTVVCGLIAPADLSTAGLIFFTSIMLMFVAGVDTKYLGVLGLVGIFALFILFGTAKRADTWRTRIDDYVERLSNPDYDANYQTNQANIAIASGGIIGKGVGKSTQRNFLPHAHADFVYAIIIEEYGLMGGILVLVLYLILLFRSVSIVTVSKTFGALMASGLSFLVVMQAFLNIGVTVGLLPVTGLPLPMVSMGGTSIIFTCIALGIILSVSRDAMEKGIQSGIDTSGQKRKRRKVFSVAIK